MSDQVELWCQNGQHAWMRDSQRGKKPFNCPEHRPEPQSHTPLEKTERKKRTITPEHVRAIQAGRRRKAEETAIEVTQALQERLGRVRKALAEADVQSRERRAVVSAQGGMGNCSDKAFSSYAALVDRVAGLLDAQRSIETNLAGRMNGESKE